MTSLVRRIASSACVLTEGTPHSKAAPISFVIAQATLADREAAELRGLNDVRVVAQAGAGVSMTRPSRSPNTQTSISGGSTPRVVRMVQIWLR